MFSEILDFVISHKLLMSLPLAFLKVDSSFSSIRKNFPKPRFNLGDWVWTEFTVEDSSDSDDGKTYKSVGYVIGIVYDHPEWNITDVNCDYVYYVQLIYQDGSKLSSRVTDEIPDYELHLLG